jgi:hypothetical protein
LRSDHRRNQYCYEEHGSSRPTTRCIHAQVFIILEECERHL